MQNRLLELERRIIEDKRQLNDMSRAVYGGTFSAEFVNAKLNNMQSDIEYMEQQMLELRQAVENAPATELNQEASCGQPSVMPQYAYYNQQSYQYQQPYYVQANATQSSTKLMDLKDFGTPKIKSKDMETAVGKTIMGIAASVLIFISLVLFAKLIIPHLTDTIKQILMYVVSIGITTFGLIKLNKNRDSVLFLSISACGVGSLFISLFLSHVYFDTYNEIVLYVLLFIWAVGACVLSKLRSEAFHIIGQTGIFISVFYGMQFCMIHSDIKKMLIITIYFIVGGLIFYFTHNNSKKNFIISSAYNLISVFILFWGISDYSDQVFCIPYLYNAGYIILLAYIVFNMILPLFWSGVGHIGESIPIINKYANATGTVNAVYYVAFCLVLIGLISTENVLFPVMLVSSLMYLIITEYVRRNEQEVSGINVFYLSIISMMIVSIYGIEWLHKLFGVAIVIIPCMLYGFIKDKKLFKYVSIFVMILFLCSSEAYIPMLIILGVAMLSAAMYFIFTEKEQYSIKLKNVVLGLIMLFAIIVPERFAADDIFQYQYMDCLKFVLLAIIAGIAAKSAYVKNPVTGAMEQETRFFVNVIIAMLMLVGMGNISSCEEVVPYVIYVIFTIALFMLNTKEQLKDKSISWYGAYVGIKFTILMVVILNSFEAESFVVSIFCFLFAVGSICIGFFIKHKELRVYGLVLSLISVVKLIMIDITYDNTLGHALSFFVSGLLCFVISAIYTRVEKSMQQGEQKD